MRFYRCSICGRIEVLKDGEEKDLICCNQRMQELKSKSVDASVEKHVPYCTIVNDKINVSVGEVLHPMTEEHHIEFIAQYANDKLKIVNLKVNKDAKAVFDYVKGSKIFSYCNLHGLFESGEL